MKHETQPTCPTRGECVERGSACMATRELRWHIGAGKTATCLECLPECGASMHGAGAGAIAATGTSQGGASRGSVRETWLAGAGRGAPTGSWMKAKPCLPSLPAACLATCTTSWSGQREAERPKSANAAPPCTFGSTALENIPYHRISVLPRCSGHSGLRPTVHRTSFGKSLRSSPACVR